MDAFVILPRNSMGCRRRCLQGKVLTGKADSAKLISLKCFSPNTLSRTCSQAVEMQHGWCEDGKTPVLDLSFHHADPFNDHRYILGDR